MISQSQFFSQLYPKNITDGYIELRSFIRNQNPMRSFLHVSRLDQIEHTSKKIEYDHFYGVALRKESGKGDKSNCLLLTTLFADIDFGNAGHKKDSFHANEEDALSHIERFRLQPSFIVNSGHGLHLYWLLKEPLILNADNVRLAESTMKLLSRALGGDSVHDVSRILRIPGTRNNKTEVNTQCRIIQANCYQRYSFADIISITQNDPIFQIEWSKIDTDKDLLKTDGKQIKRKQAYLNAIFGSNNFGNDDRSEVDAKIITYLLLRGFSESEISTIFKSFKCSGKYLERMISSSSSAEQYLTHTLTSINNYLNQHNRRNISIVKNQTIDLPTDTIYKSKYAYSKEIGKTGYYLKSDQEPVRRISNFILEIESQSQYTVDSKPIIFLKGQVILDNGENHSFDNLPAINLHSPKEFTDYLINLCGISLAFFDNSRVILNAIKTFNTNIPMLVARQYGYNKDLTKYVTEDLVITQDKFVKKYSPIINQEIWGNNKLGFEITESESVYQIKKEMIKQLLNWDDKYVIYSGLAFTFLPLLYPYIKHINPNKPYMIYRGPSGSGKSTLCKIFQRFFGNFENLLGWTSTDTTLTSIGNAFKDSILVIDDLKSQNFPTEYERLKAVKLLQNYSDNYSRNRSNGKLEIRDERFIRAFLMISAEDLVFRETSTLARSIIVEVHSKEANFDQANNLEILSKEFHKITPHYIQYLMKNITPEKVSDIFNETRTYIKGTIDDFGEEISNDNLSRIINNFSMLKTSWNILSTFLFEEDEYSVETAEFDVNLELLLFRNIQRINEFKPEVKFIETFWSMVESKLLCFDYAGQNSDSYKSRNIGTYVKYEDGIKICLNLNTAFKEVNAYLRDEGGLGISKDTLISKLIKERKIRVPESGRVSLTSTIKRRGVEWIGDFPKDIFNIFEETPADFSCCELEEESDELPF